MQRFWEDDVVQASDGRTGRVLRVGWDEDQAELDPPVRRAFATLCI